MKKLLLIALVGLGLLGGVLSASSERDATFNIYGVGAQTDKNQNSFYGGGLAIDSESFKGKFEFTEEFFKTALIYKYNPLKDFYIKFGANYINQKMYAVDNSNASVNQYSGALATGYMISDTFYAEIGGSFTSLSGTKIGTDYEIKDEDTSLAYLEVATRLGDLDFTANAGKVFYEFRDNELSYGLGADYYLGDAKLGYNYQNEKNNNVSTYSLEYGYLYAEVVDNMSTKTYQANLGARIAFTDLTDFSTYTMPNNGKRHLSELHRFESVSSGNMYIKSANGVARTTESLAKSKADAVTPAVISTPTIALADQTISANRGVGSIALPAPTVTNVLAGAVYSMVTSPSTDGKLTINASTGVATWSGTPFLGAEAFSVTITVLNTDGGTSSTTFTLLVTT